MPQQCPFPVRSADNRRCYRAGSVPGCALALALIVALLGYVGFVHGAPLDAAGSMHPSIPAAQTD